MLVGRHLIKPGANIVELFLLLNLTIMVLDRKEGLYLGPFLPSAVQSLIAYVS